MAVRTEDVDFDTATFKVLCLCVILLLLKMFFMVPLIVLQRIINKVVISPEDRVFFRNLKVKHNDVHVERPRRAFLNDLENILIFVAIAGAYATTEPSPFVAVPLFAIYTLARYCHTFVYAVAVLKQPSRFLAYAVGYVITAYMAGYVVYHTKDAM